MKYTILLAVLIQLILGELYAQDHEDYTSLKGSPQYLDCIVVTPERDSIPALMENQRELYKLYGDKSGKIDVILATTGKQTLKPEEFKGYELTLRNKKTQQFYSVDGMVVQIKYAGGQIKLFEREEFVLRAPRNAIMVNSNVRKRYYVRKKYEAYLTDVDDIAENVQLAEYFEDCPVLSKKIGQPKSRLRDIVSLVQRYDGCDTGN